jgi:hypothetical protein
MPVAVKPFGSFGVPFFCSPTMRVVLNDESVRIRMSDYDEPRVSTSAQVSLPNSDEASGGVLEVDGEAIALRVSPSLVSSAEVVEATAGVMIRSGHNHAADDLAILIRAPMRPSRATIWHGYVTSEKGVLFSGPSEVEGQTITASILIVGSHLPDPQTRFSAVQIDATNLADWAQLPSAKMDIRTDTLRARWSLEPPEPVSEPLVGVPGTMRLHPTFSFGAPSMQGFKVDTGVRATFSVEGGLSLTQIRRQFLRPFVDLMVMLSGERSDISHLGLEHDGRWLGVRGHGVLVDAPPKKVSCSSLATRWA